MSSRTSGTRSSGTRSSGTRTSGTRTSGRKSSSSSTRHLRGVEVEVMQVGPKAEHLLLGSAGLLCLLGIVMVYSA
ncbi:MAG: hypothetical protein F2809_09310, partial [Actinobacteria bacterium]|nr:hypothetical protein [Actinomycetota bacterium]